jgi:hypothetical protein
VAMDSKSQVEHLLPPDLQRMLNIAALGIIGVATESRRTVRETQQQFYKYFIILLAGRLSQEYFVKLFINDHLEYLERTYSKDLTERNLNEDVERFNYLNKALYSTIPERKETFDTTRATIVHYLDQPEVKQAIHTIAGEVKGNRKINRAEIEKLFSKNDFLNYCAQEHPTIMEKLV